MKKLPAELKLKIVNLRRQGLLYKTIARELNITRCAVGRVCREAVPELREVAHPHIPEEDIQEITRLRRKGLSYSEIAEKVGCCLDTVLGYCNKYCPGLKNICHPWRLNKDVERRICFLYETGLTQRDVMKKLRVGEKAVRNSLRRNGFVQKRGRRLIRYSNARDCVL